MPDDQQRLARSRQRPVSCRFCRTRKLRCSRSVPCSNCVSRGITCDLDHPAILTGSGPRNSDNAEILDRLQRLEELLASSQRSEEQAAPDGQPPIAPESREQQLAQPLPLVVRYPIVTDQPGRSKISRSHVTFQICPIAQVTKAQTSLYINPRETDPSAEPGLSRCIWLPPRIEAQVLLDKFIRVAHYLPYATHVPSLPSILEQVYSGFQQRRQVPSGQLILLLSIIAAATHFWTQNDCSHGLFSTPAEANDQTPLWIKAAEDALDIVRRSPEVSIEGVQGTILAEFVAAHVDGLQRSRALFTISLELARDLGLHRIDHPSNAGMANTAQAEIGRRVWWYLCASDWSMAARVGGMGEGVYSCHPRQMITKKPLNINDNQVFDGMSRDERPLSEPTTMSYTMQRIRLAEVSRSIVDRSPLSMAHSSGLSHDAVMAIDTELQTLINDVPAFYSMAERELMNVYSLARPQAEVIVFQGMIIYLILFLQRCKLHLPYLTARSSEGPEYYLSREICIKSARLIIQSKLWQKNADADTETRFKFTELLSGVFCACIILLMDLCVNPTSSEYETQRDEVYQSFKIIEEAKNGSEASAGFVDTLLHILQKHNKPPPQDSALIQQQQQQQQQQPAEGFAQGEMTLDNPEAPEYGNEGNLSFPEVSPIQTGEAGGLDLSMVIEEPLYEDGGFSSFWDELTQNFKQGNDVGNFDWDKIFAELDSSIV